MRKKPRIRYNEKANGAVSAVCFFASLIIYGVCSRIDNLIYMHNQPVHIAQKNFFGYKIIKQISKNPLTIHICCVIINTMFFVIFKEMNL
jgi:hypothetical protein